METAPGLAQTLRPLGLGEILDRAVNVTVKYFVLFALIAAIFAIPEIIIQYFTSEETAKFFSVLAQLLKQGGKGDAAAALASVPRAPLGWTLFSLGWFFMIQPLLSGAMIAAVSARYLGEPVDVARAYKVGLGRWAHLVAINVMYVASGALAYLVAIIVGIVVVLVGVMIVSAFKGVGIALAVVLGIVAGLALLAAFLVVMLCYKMSYMTCVVEQKGFISAFASGLERIFNRIGFRRALIVGLAYVAIVVGVAIVQMIGIATLFALIPNRLAGSMFAGIIGLGWVAFDWTFMTIFYFDLRVREEGLDLQLAARDLDAGTALQP